MHLEELTGRGVRVAVIDSGVHAAHPHIADTGNGASGNIIGGVAIRDDGSLDDDYMDRLGHGTAVTAAILEKAPDAAIVVIKVFWGRLATDMTTLVRAIDESCARRATVINLSLGTTDFRHLAEMEAAAKRATDGGALIVAAAEDEGVRWLPGSLDDTVPVKFDWACPRDAYRLIGNGGRTIVVASGYPRGIPGVSRERNLKGISFAVANVTGFVARACEACPGGSEAPPGGRASMILETLATGTNLVVTDGS